MKWYHKQVIKTPQDCLALDYDIQAQVERIHDRLQLQSKIIWVKGHQDVKKSFRDLKWEEKLNIRADFLATKARHEISTSERNKLFECLPTCLAHL
eukprot:7842280-Ditylum_brightwellii.AAC.1